MFLDGLSSLFIDNRRASAINNPNIGQNLNSNHPIGGGYVYGINTLSHSSDS